MKHFGFSLTKYSSYIFLILSCYILTQSNSVNLPIQEVIALKSQLWEDESFERDYYIAEYDVIASSLDLSNVTQCLFDCANCNCSINAWNPNRPLPLCENL